MDFLDPKKERRNHLTLLLGYCLVALAIAIATLILLYQSYGYNVDRQGIVTQNGLLFVSSQPSGAEVYMNNKRYKSNTDTRVLVPAGNYNLKISQAGYRDWQRPVVVNGGDVQHFDYPFLFPQNLKTTSLADTDTVPTFSSQSLDKRWLLIAQNDNNGTFTEYDFKNPAKPVSSTITLPGDSFTPGSGEQTWTQVEWANDNQHLLLLHTFVTNDVTNREYVLLNRDTPAESTNVSKTLNLNQTQTLTLFNNRVSQFFVYNPAEQTLSRVNATDGAEVSKIQHVLSFKTYADNKILYVADESPTGKSTAGQVSVVMQDGQKTITLRTLPSSATGYVLNLAQYAGNWYVAVGSSSDAVVYVYKNPQTVTSESVDDFPAPWRRLSLQSPSYLAFSANTQYLLVENGQEVVVYDFENINQYRYRLSDALDTPQTHATWMDGNRLTYVSGGKLVVLDYDNRNKQMLMSASPTAQPFFAPDYSYVYALRSASEGTKPGLSSTALRVTP